MHSGGHRGFTVVTIITLVFAPIFAHNHWMWKLVGKTKQIQIVQCVAKNPCPSHTRTVNIVTLPQAPTPPPNDKGKGKGSDSNDPGAIVVDDPSSVPVSDDGDDEPAAPKQH